MCTIKSKRNLQILFISGYTSNLISGGTRESLRYLVQHKMVDCISSTAGGIEEDFIKCLIPSTVGTFELAGKDMFEKKLNRCSYYLNFFYNDLGVLFCRVNSKCNKLLSNHVQEVF